MGDGGYLLVEGLKEDGDCVVVEGEVRGGVVVGRVQKRRRM